MRFGQMVKIGGVVLPAVLIGAATVGGQQKPSVKAKAAAKPGVAATANVSFREEIEPFLKANCGSCHSEEKRMSGFHIDTVGAIFAGGKKHGAKVLVAGKPSESALVSYLRGNITPRMPLGGSPVAPEQIAKIEAWIQQGAKVDAVKLGWPYLPPAVHAVPKVKNAAWMKNPVDAFILAKLEAKGLKPSPPAGKVTLLRRVYADLVGVPPTPQEAEAFLSDTSPDAYEKIVDRLLADPRYGERWGRHWLDLVRYADSSGYESDEARPRAWRYRDYVIRAFNSDKPYDRFLKEQIAGDELYPNDSDALTATGFARLAPWDALSREPDQRWQDYLNDVTDTTGSVMLGLTVGCARCHNHKYDKIGIADYYKMQAFFKQTEWREVSLPDTSSDPVPVRKMQAETQARLAALRDELKATKDGNRRKKLEEEINQEEDRRRPFAPVADVIADRGKDAPKAFILLRGNLATPGAEVQPGFITALNKGQATPAMITPPAGQNSTGRRTVLASWIASPDNPMTARVLVNRLWQHHFGRGIVGTPSDFGINGDRPSHPELLDWLARYFVTPSPQNGNDGRWSLKKMHRLMLTSNAYRQSTQPNPAGESVDSTNRLLWRMNRIRLEGEPLRDSILAVSGRLNPEPGGPGIFPKVSGEVLSTGSTHKWGDSPDDQGRRRTVYVFQRRSLVLPIVEAFDGPDTGNTCPRRATTTIAPQALALFNSDFTRTESKQMAERVVTEAGKETAKQIERAYRLALVRLPTAAQKTLAHDFLNRQTLRHLKENKTPDAETTRKARLAALADLCHVLINTNEFLYLD